MIIGVPTEIKKDEYRVSLLPSGARELIARGHVVVIEKGAGNGSSLPDELYIQSGAKILDTAEEVFELSDIILKVKEPQPSETAMLKEGQILFTYLHLAPDPIQTKGLVNSGCVAIAYETVTDQYGGLPLLAPMSEVAGRLSVQAGSRCLERPQGGRGVLLGGVAGVDPGHVVVIGGGVVGTNAVRMAIGKEARVTVLDLSMKRLRDLDLHFGSRLNTICATTTTLETYLPQADLVIGAVLVPGGSSPKVVTRGMLKSMKPGAVLVDVSIDQGGCFETSKATTHQDPIYVVDDVVHYCVANMPGAVPYSSSAALSITTLPYVFNLVDLGYKEALKRDPHFRNGLNVYHGKITHKAVAEDLNYEYHSPEEVLNN